MMMRNQSAHANPLLVGRELNPKHKGYLAARGVTLDIAKQAGLCSVSENEAKELDLGSNAGLLIPYSGPELFCRLRLDNPFKGKNGKPQRYMTPKGEDVRPYLAPMLAEIWQDNTKPLYIVEGPIKALALICVGLVAIGLAGVNTGHQKGAPVDCLHDEIFAKVKLPKRRVVILFDGNKATNKDVARAEKKQAELYAAAGADVFVATLPPAEKGKDGPDDFLAANSVDALRAIVDAAKPLKEAYPPEEKVSKKTQAQIVVELIQEAGAQVWFDVQGVVWCTFQVGDHLEHHRMRSEATRRYLRQLTHEKAGIIPGAQSVADAIATLEAITPRAEPFPVFVRMGEHEGRLYLDLGSHDWSAVEVDAQGWHLVKVPPVRFRRSKGMLPLPTPIKGGDLGELRRFLNTPQETEWRFVVAWLLAALRAKGPYPIAILQGEQGCAKSTTARVIRALVDPNACALRTSPRNEQDLAIAASNGRVMAYDNLSGVPEWLSDALCRAATGGGFASRTLYSDDEETLHEFQRPVLLNGIDEVATRGDLADRALLVHLPRIEEENRREESDVWRDFEEARPRILGALLDVVSAGLRKLPSIKAKRLPRMADFAKWILACEESLGWEPESFLEAYFGARDQMAETVVDGDLFARSVVELIKEKKEWKGTSSELLSALTGKLEEAARRAKGWPQDATRISNKLRRIAPSLRRVNVEIEFDIKEGKDRTRKLRLKLFQLADAADATTPSFQLDINKEEKEGREESPPFRKEAQNSVRSVRSDHPQRNQGVMADAEADAADANPKTASASKPMKSLKEDAADAADAEKRTFSIQASKENLNVTNPSLNNEELKSALQLERGFVAQGYTPEEAERAANQEILQRRQRGQR